MKKILYHKYNLPADIVPLSLYTKITGVKFLAPFYHIVAETPPPHLNTIYRVRSTKDFENDLDFLLKYFRPVDLATLLSAIKEKRIFSKPSFFLSFDDGLREFHDVIVPILLRKGIPATCFINTGFLDNKDLFYRYKICLLINKIQEDPGRMVPVVNKWLDENNLLSESYVHSLLKIDYSHRYLADDLAGIIHLSFNEYLHRAKPYLTVDQIFYMIRKGFTFGSHSIDHPVYQNLQIEEQIRQTVESSKVMTSKFGLPYRIFSFPFTDSGISGSFFEKINSSAKFDLTFGCAGMKSDSFYRNIQRIPAEEYDVSLKKRIKRDYFYYMVKSLISKNRIKRNR